MVIKKFKSEDADEIIQLFKQTVRAINAKDYNAEQLNAWVSFDNKELEKKLANPETFVAWKGQKIVGFGGIRKTGEVDFIFVDKDHQKLGIASALYSEMVEQAREWGLKKLFADVSITARPFFEKKGFEMVKEQEVERQGRKLRNYLMEKLFV